LVPEPSQLAPRGSGRPGQAGNVTARVYDEIARRMQSVVAGRAALQ
jgi:hypothetical protein